MNTLPRQIISIILVLLIAFVMYYGSFLPLRKSQQYIRTRQTQVNALDKFNELYGGVLGFPSPVGQDEIVSNYLEVVATAIGQERNKEAPNELIVRSLVASSTMWADPIIEKGAGFSFSQIIFNFASVYRDAAIALKDMNYYKKAVELFNLGLQSSPDRQIFLYNLFDLYRVAGDNENARKIGERIIEVYNDEKVKEIMKTL